MFLVYMPIPTDQFTKLVKLNMHGTDIANCVLAQDSWASQQNLMGTIIIID